MKSLAYVMGNSLSMLKVEGSDNSKAISLKYTAASHGFVKAILRKKDIDAGNFIKYSGNSSTHGPTRHNFKIH